MYIPALVEHGNQGEQRAALYTAVQVSDPPRRTRTRKLPLALGRGAIKMNHSLLIGGTEALKDAWVKKGNCCHYTKKMCYF